MKKILLPTDFSENSWNAIVYAIHFYKDQNCEFTLLHTYTPIFYQLEYMEPSTRAFQTSEAMKTTTENKLSEFLDRIHLNFDIPNHTFKLKAAFNTLISEINQLYDNSEIDLIIMGTKGASGIQGVLFGSNTIHVLNSVKCPVIAIPSQFEFEAPKEILFPSDYEIEFKDYQLDPIYSIAHEYNSRLHIFHVTNNGHLSDNQFKNRDTLEFYFKSLAPLFHEVKNKNVPEAISEFQIKAKVNLLVMINNKHSFFENLFFKSKINQIGFHLNIPFLVIPTKH